MRSYFFTSDIIQQLGKKYLDKKKVVKRGTARDESR